MRPMKDSGIPWIGMIPKSWEPFPIKHCADLDKEKLSEKTDYECGIRSSRRSKIGCWRDNCLKETCVSEEDNYLSDFRST